MYHSLDELIARTGSCVKSRSLIEPSPSNRFKWVCCAVPILAIVAIKFSLII